MSFISLPLQPVVLSVCCTAESGPKSSSRNRYRNICFNELTAKRLHAVKPHAVIAWLFCTDYDIFDVASALSLSGYDGQLIAMSPPLPNKALVCSEVRALFPNLRFDISFTGKIGMAARAYFDSISLELA